MLWEWLDSIRNSGSVVLRHGEWWESGCMVKGIVGQCIFSIANGVDGLWDSGFVV